MNREAKIGLIVALAFLMVIGILLSDHVTVANSEPRANLEQTAGSIGSSISHPVDGGRTIQPPILPENTGGQPYPAEVNTGHQALAGTEQRPLSSDDDLGGMQEVTELRPAPGAWQHPTDIEMPTGPIAQNDDDVFGDITEPVDPTPAQVDPVPAQPETAPSNAVTIAEYVAQPGDSLSKIAAKVFGRSTPDNIKKLRSLNESWQGKDLVVAGRTYQVPANPAAMPTTPVRNTAPASNQAGGLTTYVVKENDSLWKIAAKELGNGALHEKILDVNPKLKANPNLLRPGMEINLPASVASSN